MTLHKISDVVNLELEFFRRLKNHSILRLYLEKDKIYNNPHLVIPPTVMYSYQIGNF